MKRHCMHVLSLVLVLAMLVSPIQVFADTQARIRVCSTATSAGERFDLVVSAEDITDLAAVDLIVSYDINAFSYVDYTGYANGSTYSVNSCSDGIISVSIVNANGIYGDLPIIVLHFTVNENAKSGQYPVSLGVGDTFDSKLNSVRIKAESGEITVLDHPTCDKEIGFNCDISCCNLSQDDLIELCYSIGDPKGLSSGNIELFYDPDQLSLENLEMGVAMSGVIYSVNSRHPGYVNISFATENGIKQGVILSVSLKSIINENACSMVTMKPAALYDSEHCALTAYDCTTSVYNTPKTEVIDYPDLWITPDKIADASQPFTLGVMISGESNVAAADFYIYYNSNMFDCIAEPVPSNDVMNDGATVVVSSKYSEGVIRFSFVKSGGIVQDTRLINMEFKAKNNVDTTFEIRSEGLNVIDGNYNPINLDYHPFEMELKHAHDYTSTVIAPTCTIQGYTIYTCACGDSYIDNYVDAKGHTYDAWEAISNTQHQRVCVNDASHVEIEKHHFTGNKCDACGYVISLLGDVNGDGDISMADVTLIRRYLTDAEKYPLAVPGAADVNNDGDISMADVTLIRRYLTDAEKYPLGK